MGAATITVSVLCEEPLTAPFSCPAILYKSVVHIGATTANGFEQRRLFNFTVDYPASPGNFQ